MPPAPKAHKNFLSFWKAEAQSEEPTDSQLDLLGNSHELPAQRSRLDNATIYRLFTQAIIDNGGNAQCISDAVQDETLEMFGCTLRDLYSAVGVNRTGRRDLLPTIVQLAYAICEGKASLDLRALVGTLPQSEQDAANDYIRSVVKANARTTRKQLPW